MRSICLATKAWKEHRTNVKGCLGLAELWADVFHGLMSSAALNIVLITNKIDKMIRKKHLRN